MLTISTVMRFKSFMIVICGILSLAPPIIIAESLTKAEDQALRFAHRERSLQPGEAVFFEVESSRPLRRMTAEAFGRKFPVFVETGGLKSTGLLGIDLDTGPGRYPVRLTGIDAAGGTVAVQDTLTVTQKIFPSRRLTVEQKYVSPPTDVLDRIREEREKVNAVFASVTTERLWNGPFRLPVPGEVISAFGKRSIYNGQPRSPHTGVDFRGSTGTPIQAPNGGRVVLVSDLYYSGNTVIIDHGMGLYSYFGHMSAFSVKEGEVVKTGDPIGKIGATGLVTGPHLHWTVRLAGTRVDPLSLVQILSGSARDNR
jgi:murein DD-endopeptidase MepM/ murein hydrolase activator NlpD